MTTLIELTDMISLHTALKANGNEAHADILMQMHSINCEDLDVDDKMNASEEIVDAAGIARDIADAAVMNRQQDAADARADDEYSTFRADGI